MGSICISSALLCFKTLSTSPKSRHKARIVYSSGPKVKSEVEIFSLSPYNSQKITHSYEASTCNGLKRNGGCMAVACGAKDSAGSPEEQKALETVLKLYDAMKNKNHYELSNIISEDCNCISNFVSTFQPFCGKKQVLAFLSSLMKKLGNNIVFLVQQTSDDGMIVGVSWKLEWNKVPIPLGKGFSFHMCHVYQGKVMIKNVEIFLEPLLHLEPFRLKIITSVMNVMEKLNPLVLFWNRERRAVKVMFILLFLSAMAFVIGHRKLA